MVVGIIDPSFFLGGTIPLSGEMAHIALEKHIAKPLGINVEEAAASVIELATENMVQAISDITINQGIDPAKATLVGGGGAAGLNLAWIARRLGCKRAIIPDTGPALSAAGALMSDLAADYQATYHTATDRFDFDGVAAAVKGLTAKAKEFETGVAKNATSHNVSYVAEARYSNQVWEIEVPLTDGPITDEAGLEKFKEAFHIRHEELFAYADVKVLSSLSRGSPEFGLNWETVMLDNLALGPIRNGSDQTVGVFSWPRSDLNARNLTATFSNRYSPRGPRHS